MTVPDLVDIVIASNKKVTDELTQKAAAVLGSDLYRARALLASKIPRIISQMTDPQSIESLINQIKTLGLVSFSVKDLDLQQPMRLFKANTLEFADNNIVYKDKKDQLFTFEKNQAFLILKGNLKTNSEKEIVTSVKKLNVTATLLTGGFPISRTKHEKSKVITTQNEVFLRIFARNSMDFCIEIRQYSFNYSCLGSKMAPSSMLNINLIAGRIKDFLPDAIFNDILSESAVINTYSPGPRENIDVDCKLFYLYYNLPNMQYNDY
jgi:hypothetical protein